VILVGRESVLDGYAARWVKEEVVFLQITPSERDALELLANGTTTDEIARCLGVTVSEAEARLAALFAKMGTATRRDAVAAAFRRGLVLNPH
jgi:DNA-binding CsgD family transcriptional regulator